MLVAILGYLLAGFSIIILLMSLLGALVRGYLGILGALIGGILTYWLFDLAFPGIVIGLIVGWAINFRDADKENKNGLLSDWITILLGGIISFTLFKIDIGDMICPKDGHAAWVVFVATIPPNLLRIIPFHRFLPYFSDDSERIRLSDLRFFFSDLKYIRRYEIIDFITENVVVKQSICIGGSLLICWIVFGTDLLHLFDIYVAPFSLKALVFFYLYTIINFLLSLLDYEEWKIVEDFFKGIYGLLIGICLYIYLGDVWKDNPPVYEGSWLQQLRDGLASVFDWIGGFLPDWFFADGWLGLWELFRSAVCGLISLFFNGVLFAIPFGIIYEKWHESRDMPCTSYEWTTVLIFFPIFVYANSWYVYMGDNGWFSKAFMMFISFITFFFFACDRRRCPKCGSNKDIGMIDYDKKRGRVELTKSESETVYYDGQEIGKHTTDSYRQKVTTKTSFHCDRCGHKWTSYHSSFDRWTSKDGWGYEKKDFNM